MLKRIIFISLAIWYSLHLEIDSFNNIVPNYLFKINALQVTNKTGQNITPEISKIILKIIQQSSIYSGSDLLKNTIYIKNQLEKTFNQTIGINILSKKVLNDQIVRNTDGQTYIIWSDVNVMNPNWIYFIWGIQKNSKFVENINSLGRGSEMVEYYSSMITQIIKYQENFQVRCSCSKIKNIEKNLEEADVRPWNIICQQEKSFTRISTANWVYLKPKYCYYLIFIQ